ncbi:MAG TPA: cysteine desulfurase family protein [Candidatus Avamphibacillus sp.]|nr:cysteine desulfurase family protein [Candidatus Avamphibacillus sp.]
MIYLDNSATTKPYPEVLESFRQVSTQFFANPSSIHQFGGKTETLLTKARVQAASILNVKPNEIIFTSGGTEGNNMAIKGIALEHQHRGKHIITTEIEHPSVYDTCKSLEKLGFEITYLPVNEEGIISLTDLKKAIRQDTIMISVMHVNNELGSIQPIEEIGEVSKDYPKLFFHVDHVQGLGKVPLDFKKTGIDLCTMSGHKIHGLKGSGIIYIRQGTSIYPLLHGGGQEGEYRSGTENVAGSVSMVKALRMCKEKMHWHIEKMNNLKKHLRTELEKIDGVVVNTPVQGAPHLMNFSVPGLKPEVMIHSLGESGIALSTKSACSSKQLDESRVLSACGFSERRSKSAFRVSMSYDTTKEDITIFLKEFKKTVRQLKEVMG